MINKITKYLAIGLASMLMAASSHADTKVQFALDWKFEGPSAPYFLAIDKGHFKSAGTVSYTHLTLPTSNAV